MKTCTKCGEDLPLNAFDKKRATKEGLRSWCRQCSSLHKAIWNKNNKERRQKQQKAWQGLNSEHVSAYHKAKSSTDEHKFKHGVSAAKQRGLLWTVTFTEWQSLVKDNKCHYCYGGLSVTGHSLDRKDNNLCYILSNVVCCCWPCNEFKRNMLTYDEMVAVVALLKAMREQSVLPRVSGR